jgi:hypothetical protein
VGDLQQLVEQRLRELGDHRGPMPTRRAAARSEGRVSYETLRLLKIGQHSGAISHEVAEGIALALDVPVNVVLKVAGQRIPQGPFVLPKRAETLTKSERAVVLSVVDAILDAVDQDRSLESGRSPDAAALRSVAKSGERPGGSRSGAGRASQTARRVRKGQEPLR